MPSKTQFYAQIHMTASKQYKARIQHAATVFLRILREDSQDIFLLFILTSCQNDVIVCNVGF